VHLTILNLYPHYKALFVFLLFIIFANVRDVFTIKECDEQLVARVT